MARFLDEGVHVLPQARAAFDDDRPDVLLGDIGSYPARVLAHQWSRPLVPLSPTYVAWDGYEQDMAEVLDGLRAAPGYAAYHERFAAWLTAEDVPVDVDTFTGRPPRSVVLVPRAMQPHADDVDPRRYTFVGPALAVRAHQERCPSRTARCCWSPSARPTPRRPGLPGLPRRLRRPRPKCRREGRSGGGSGHTGPGPAQRLRAPLGAAALRAGARVGVARLARMAATVRNAHPPPRRCSLRPGSTLDGQGTHCSVSSRAMLATLQPANRRSNIHRTRGAV